MNTELNIQSLSDKELSELWEDIQADNYLMEDHYID